MILFKNEKFTNTISQLRSDLAVSQTQCDSLQKSLNSSQLSSEDLSKNLAITRAEIFTLQKSLQKQETSKKLLIKNLQRLKKKSIVTAQTKLDEFRLILKNLVKFTENEIQQCQLSNIRLIKSIGSEIWNIARDQTLATINFKFNNKLENLEKDSRKKLERQTEEWASKSSDLNSKIEDLQKNLMKMQNEINNVTRQRDELEHELEKKIQENKELAHQLTKINDEYNILFNKYDENFKTMKPQQALYKQQCSDFIAGLKKLRNEVENIKQNNILNIKQFDRKLDIIKESQQNEYNKLFEQYSGEIDVLNKKLTAAHKNVEKYSKNTENYEARMIDLEKEIQILSEEKKNIELENNGQLKEMKQSFQELINETSSSREKLHRELIEKQLELENLKTKAAKNINEVKLRDEEILFLKNEKAKIAKQLEELKMQLEMRTEMEEVGKIEKLEDKRRTHEEIIKLQSLLSRKYGEEEGRGVRKTRDGKVGHREGY